MSDRYTEHAEFNNLLGMDAVNSIACSMTIRILKSSLSTHPLYSVLIGGIALLVWNWRVY
jgi:hypothetical protein